MTALTEYFTTTASTTNASANEMLANVSTTATLTNKNTNLVSGTTGWITVYPAGNGTAQTGAGSQPALDDICWLDDSTLLEGNHLNAGTWSFTQPFETTATGTFIADFHYRIFKRSADGSTRTLIGEAVASSQTIISTAYTNVTPSVSASASGTFATGEKLGIRLDLNITTNTTTGNLRMQEASSTTLGNTSAQVVSPGYSSSTQTDKKWMTRLYQYVIAQKAYVTRLYQYAVADKTFTTRFNQYDYHKKFTTRFFQFVRTDKTFSSRLKQVGQVQHAYLCRFGQYDPNSTTQMLYDDLQQQYNRLRASSTNASIELLALVYYTSSQILSEHALPGELDVLLTGENISTDLHILKTVADVTAFITAHP